LFEGDENMDIVIISTAVVVLADKFDPTILHPAFLKAQDIVPSAWKSSEPPICTPNVSRVKYDNGVVFLQDRKRLQVVQEVPPVDLSTSPVATIADKYIKALSDIRYEAVGVNVRSFVECERPETELVKRFLKPGSEELSSLKLVAFGVKFNYEVPHGVLRLSCDPGVYKGLGDTVEKIGIVANGNYHTDISEPEGQSKVKGAISLFPRRGSHFAEVVEALLGLES